MGLFINLALLTFGFIGALAAFGGETCTKTDEPLLRRITKRGWLSIICLGLALIFGITKEIRSSYSADEEYKKRQILEQQLQLTGQQLEAANDRLKVMSLRVEAVPRQRYSDGFSIPAHSEQPLRSKLYGGDKFEYSGNCAGLILKTEQRSYTLDNTRPVLIDGPKGMPMKAIIINQADKVCFMKINVHSIEQQLYLVANYYARLMPNNHIQRRPRNGVLHGFLSAPRGPADVGL